jgi:exodeoxyribonuclease-1
LAGQYDDKEASPHIEEQIYRGFPSNADKARMERFHALPWPDRYALSQGFEDERYRQFATRLIYVECPDGLPAERKAALDEWRLSRISETADVPWLTIEKAKLELVKIKSMAKAEDDRLIADIVEHYHNQ